MLYTYLKSGTFVISEDIKVFIDEYEKVYALDEKLTREINGYFEADNVEIIRCFFETATEYTKNLVNISKQKDKIKILTFDFSWECDCLVNKKSFNTVHLPSKMFNDFKSDIENFMSAETKQRYVELELTPSRIYALYGPPGTGKTTLIHTTASYYSKNIATLPAMVRSRSRAWALRVSSSSFSASSCPLKSSSLTASPAATPT